MIVINVNIKVLKKLALVNIKWQNMRAGGNNVMSVNIKPLNNEHIEITREMSLHELFVLKNSN